MNNPCYKCEDRKVGCHSECDKYIEWKKEHDKFQQKIREKTIGYANYVDYAIQRNNYLVRAKKTRYKIGEV